MADRLELDLEDSDSGARLITPESAGSAQPFKYHGKQVEFTLLAPLKPGGAEKARLIPQESPETYRISARLRIGTLHNLRVVLNRQRHSHVLRCRLDGDLGPVHRRLC